MANKSFYLVSAACLLLFASAAQAESTPAPYEQVISQVSAADFLMKDYKNIAISTDLEPDDVLALAIIFDEANQIYRNSSNKKYPIDLIIVGEGNTAIKRIRMEKLLKDYFAVPPEVMIEVVEGRTTADNFAYDGEELFHKDVLKQIPFPKKDPRAEASKALKKWAARSENPFVIELQAGPSLVDLSLDPALAKKTTAIIYGGVNLRKTVMDSEVFNNPELGLSKLPNFSSQHQALIDHFSDRFSKVAIVETWGILGDQPCVYTEFPWTHKIQKIVAESDDAFMKMFRTLSVKWNAYLLEHSLAGCQAKMETLRKKLGKKNSLSAVLKELSSEMGHLMKKWDEAQFAAAYKKMLALSEKTPSQMNPDEAHTWRDIMRKVGLVKKLAPSSGIQFTFADVCVALAISDKSSFFHSSPIRAAYDVDGFLKPIPDAGSNVVYYNSVDRVEFADRVEKFFNSKIN